MEIDDYDSILCDLERQLDEMRRPYLVEMVELWKTMGMGYNKGERRNVQKKRISPMVGFFKEQFEDLIKNDQKNLRDLTKEIERHCKERLELRRTLNITGNDSGEDKLSLIDVERKLRDEVAQLQKEKDERMKAYDEARAAEKIECESTGSVSCYIVINRMPTDEQVRQIKKNVSHLRELRSKREVEFDANVESIHKFYQILETEPGNAERNLVCSTGKSIQVLSEDQMDKVQKILQDLEIEKHSNQQIIVDIVERIKDISETLDLPFENQQNYENSCSSRVIEQLRAELNSLEEERKKHMAVFIQDAGLKLQTIWEKCYVDEQTKEKFISDLEAKIDEESQLDFYKENIKEWTEFYNNDERMRIFLKIDEWYSLWEDRLKLENLDPKRLGNFKALREEEKMRNRVNKRLPKAVEDITNWMDELQKKGKHFRIRGMTFDELNAYQENDHDRKVQEEKERKIEEKKKILVQESIYGVAKTPNRGGNRTLRQVKRLQHESKVVTGKSFGFATPSKPASAAVSTPGSMKRRPLREKNDTYVSGSHMAKVSIASVNENIFSTADIASSTLKADQIRKNLPTPIRNNAITPIRKNAMTPIRNNAMSTLKKSLQSSSVRKTGTQSRSLRSAKKIPFVM